MKGLNNHFLFLFAVIAVISLLLIWLQSALFHFVYGPGWLHLTNINTSNAQEKILKTLQFLAKEHPSISEDASSGICPPLLRKLSFRGNSSSSKSGVIHSDNFRLNTSDNLDKHRQRPLVFLKVHKAASSTVYNILVRHAMRFNLNVAFHRNSLHLNTMGWRIPLTKLVPIPTGEEYDILCNHVVFRKSEIERIFKRPPVYIGIIREPFERFVSSFFYYGERFRHKVPLSYIRNYPKDPIMGYLEHPHKYDEFMNQKMNMNTRLVNNVNRWRLEPIHSNNRMLADFGLSYSDLKKIRANATIVDSFIDYIDKTFDFIMVTEYFDESLVLLRRMLGWDLEDMLYIDRNVYTDKSESDERRNRFNATHKTLYAKISPGEVTFYYHFKAKFMKQLRCQNKDFFKELDVFKALRANVEHFCRLMKRRKDPHSVYRMEANKWTSPFAVTYEKCKLLMMEEPQLTPFARREQQKRHGYSSR